MLDQRSVLLLQLPIPPPGPGPLRGNVPLAAGYLKLLARSRGLEEHYSIDILPTPLANGLGDCALVEAILDREPWLVGFTCYLWNIERSLWIAERLKERRPELLIVLGGPEITRDNAWVLEQPAIDYAVVGEGEQTFCELLQALRDGGSIERPIDGLHVVAKSAGGPQAMSGGLRKPLPDLNEISSPYLHGILNAADERMLLLETIRGCIFKCKFCYYPKSYDSLYFLSEERLVANLEHARSHEADEIVLLDPTLNQRRDFDDFLRLLARYNSEGQFKCFGELRAEGITAGTAQLLKAANFTEVEIGLQSIDPLAQELMDRKNNLKAFERGVRAMLDAGIRVKIDLIIGLPGDTVDSIRRGLAWLHESGLYTSMQVFNLAVLPGTAFRQEAEMLGLQFQPRPPYYVTETPTLRLDQMLELMEEAQELFGVEFDPLPTPVLEFCEDGDVIDVWRVDLDVAREVQPDGLPAPKRLAQAFTLWFSSADLHAHRDAAAEILVRLLQCNPFTTLQVVLEPLGDPRRVTPQLLERLLRACYQHTTYLDKFYAVLPGRPKGAKRLIVVLPAEIRDGLDADWIDQIDAVATLVWQRADRASNRFEEHEFAGA